MEFISEVFTKTYIITLIVMAIISYFQNMAFTLVSRSRNSADTSFHRKCAWFSNGVWLLCQMFIWKQIWPILMNASYDIVDISRMVVTIIIYALCTAECSVKMMKISLKTEKGNRRVGANPNMKK